MPLNAKAMSRLALVLLLAAVPIVVKAEPEYPSQTVKIVVPVPPGLLLDAIPRIIAEKLAAKWGQSVIIENKPGAAANLGAEVVARAVPDGHTLLATAPGPLVVSQYVYARLGFDPAAFVPVSVLATFPFVIVVNPKLPVSNFHEFVAYAKAQQGKVTFATPGIGSTPHLAMEELMATAGIRFTHVPYKGLPPAMNDLLAGHIDAMYNAPGNAIDHINNGRLRALAVTGEKRLPELPNVPTISETFAGFVHTDWIAIVAPPKTPSAVALKLSQAIAETLKLPDVAARLDKFHVTTVGSTPTETAALLKRESNRYRQVISTAGIKVE
jgi:tripartite-type tricarboxylate transporter receptor subunit TctC